MSYKISTEDLIDQILIEATKINNPDAVAPSDPNMGVQASAFNNMITQLRSLIDSHNKVINDNIDLSNALDRSTAKFLKSYDSALIYKGRADSSDYPSAPTSTLNWTYLAMEADLWDTGCAAGDLLTCRVVSNGYTVEPLASSFIPKKSFSEWYDGDLSKVANNIRAVSLFRAIKDIWFSYDTKPSWWDSRTPRINSSVLPDYGSNIVRLYFADGTEAPISTYQAAFDPDDFDNLTGFNVVEKQFTLDGGTFKIHIAINIAELTDEGGTTNVVVSTTDGNTWLMWVKKRYDSKYAYQKSINTSFDNRISSSETNISSLAATKNIMHAQKWVNIMETASDAYVNFDFSNSKLQLYNVFMSRGNNVGVPYNGLTEIPFESTARYLLFDFSDNSFSLDDENLGTLVQSDTKFIVAAFKPTVEQVVHIRYEGYKINGVSIESLLAANTANISSLSTTKNIMHAQKWVNVMETAAGAYVNFDFTNLKILLYNVFMSRGNATGASHNGLTEIPIASTDRYLIYDFSDNSFSLAGENMDTLIKSDNKFIIAAFKPTLGQVVHIRYEGYKINGVSAINLNVGSILSPKNAAAFIRYDTGIEQSNADFDYYMENVAGGEKFKYSATGLYGSAVYGYVFLDSDDNVIAYGLPSSGISGGQSDYSNVVITVPTAIGIAKVAFNVVITGVYQLLKYSDEYSALTTARDLPAKADSSEIGADDIQPPTGDYNHEHDYGQSNDIAQQSFPPLTVTAFGGNKMIGDSVYWAERTGTAFQDLIAVIEDRGGTIVAPYDETSQVYCEMPGIAAANITKRMIDRKSFGSDKVQVVTCSSEGGKTIEELQKGFVSGYYDRIIASATQAKANADSEGKSIVCTVIRIVQGEANYRGDAYSGGYGTQDKDTYKAYILQFVSDITADLKVIYGQEGRPLIILCQVYAESNNLDNLAISQAQLELANENSNIVLANPMYIHYPSGRGNHMDPNSNRWNGEFMGKAYWQTLNGKKFTPMQPIHLKVEGSTALIDFHVPVMPMVFDDYTTAMNTDYGFEFEDDNGAVSVTEIVKEQNRLKFTFDSVVVGTLKVRYGCQQTGGGNLRDSDKWQSMYNWETHAYQVGYIPLQSDGVTTIEGNKYPMWNWCATFYYEVDGELTIDI